jgi:hypothetical protein
VHGCGKIGQKGVEVKGVRIERVNRNLLLDFFLTFSCFEYALKASGFFKRPGSYDPLRTPGAWPDWHSFATSLRDRFQIGGDSQLRTACEYLLDSPPWKQVIINDGPAWDSPIRPKNESDIEFILRMVRTVRNNLFHGGKHTIGLHKDPERTEKLLSSSLIILQECLTLVPKVKQHFDEATI